MSLGIGNATARTFLSLRRHYNYRLYFFGQVVSISGTWMQSVAQAWFVVQQTHSPLAVGHPRRLPVRPVRSLRSFRRRGCGPF